MTWVADLFGRVAGDVWSTMAADWPYLLLSILAAAAVPVYVGTDRLSRWLSQRRWLAIGAAVMLATLTPFCSCGTTAIVLGMLATRTPWAPIVAFMVASPLTSPEELLLSGGLFGWPFALIYLHRHHRAGLRGRRGDRPARARRLARGQARIRPTECPHGACPVPVPGSGPPPAAAAQPQPPTPGSSPGCASPNSPANCAGRAAELALYFTGYSAIGYLLIELLPTGLLTSLLSGHSPASIALAATLGVPVYITTEASLPMVAALVHGGLGLWQAMAFLVTGAGTSIGAITGAFVIARARVIALVVALLFAGAMVLGGLTGAILG